MFIKPGINPETGKPFPIRYPHNNVPLPVDGAEVDDNDFHFRRLREHGDVVDAEPPPAENPTEAGQAVPVATTQTGA